MEKARKKRNQVFEKTVLKLYRTRGVEKKLMRNALKVIKRATTRKRNAKKRSEKRKVTSPTKEVVEVEEEEIDDDVFIIASKK